jgi:transposase
MKNLAARQERMRAKQPQVRRGRPTTSKADAVVAERARRRMHAFLMLQDGKSVAFVANYFGVTESFIESWIAAGYPLGPLTQEDSMTSAESPFRTCVSH